ncbi:MAG: dihydrodipicolinate synthase family protein [Bacteroidota bacterium]
MRIQDIPAKALESIRKGVVIPAYPLALNEDNTIDEKYQRAIARYYLDAGAGGIAVAVHTTQFEIRDEETYLFEQVLQIAKEEFERFEMRTGKVPVRVAGIAGRTEQAVKEAKLIAGKGFHAALLSVAAFKEASNKEILEHCRDVAEEIPLVGFYLQPAVGGRKLDKAFWREFAKIENVVAIKMAPFNRYYTQDVVHGVVESGRSDEITLYTGNDDNILADLMTEFEVVVDGVTHKKKIMGGLLGHWAVWTKKAVELLDKVHNEYYTANANEILTLSAKVTDTNAAFFDAANDYYGVIVGLHEVLYRQGLMRRIDTLAGEKLMQRQVDEIDRIYAAYPELNDDEFVKANIDKWFAD